MTKHAPEQFRKVLKAEQHDYIQRAIEIARNAPAQYEGSLHPTGSTIFQHRTIHEALEHYADLKAQGWELEHLTPACYDKLFSFSAKKPEHVFEQDIPQIVLNAEKMYLREVEEHNKQAKKLQERKAFVEQEFARLEEERKAKLRTELEKQFDSRGRVQHVSSDTVYLHAR
ncbi:hypothetical protein IRZ59_16020 [Pseudomonas guariconensis]|uniref:hypothetical protein n=1 Tax=Pseudomonas guariconensis TaxID=1288410 RepID=UPI0018A8905C|nr:hypothetical protein [Pseudomonas guariconensis]MBF8731944.1 hypothetical protein [Pseudomonas guariconensis]